MSEIVDSLVEVRLSKDEDFLKVKETLTRMGVASHKERKLWQSCHILHKRGKYYLVHFKELFMLDGRPNNFDDEDKGRRNTIINLLEDWDLIEVVDETKVESPTAPISKIKIIPFSEKKEWQLIPKYNIGKKVTPVEAS